MHISASVAASAAHGRRHSSPPQTSALEPRTAQLARPPFRLRSVLLLALLAWAAFSGLPAPARRVSTHDGRRRLRYGFDCGPTGPALIRAHLTSAPVRRRLCVGSD